MTPSQNTDLATKLREMAEILATQGDDGFRVTAYRRAAATLDELETPVEKILADDGLSALVRLPAIGRSIAAALAELIQTGRWSALDRLAGALEPEQLFQTIPGIGPDLARRIHEELNVDTLEALEAAAHDGRLETVIGIGPRRANVIRAILGQRLDGRRFRRPQGAERPSVSQILDVDREYRERAELNLLRKIAPKRFNPEHRTWLPILHTGRDDWSFTALYSNTRRAHELSRTRDWVVIYAHKQDGPETQCTVVTEHQGPLEGHRVVRGREGDCLAHYATATSDIETSSERHL